MSYCAEMDKLEYCASSLTKERFVAERHKNMLYLEASFKSLNKHSFAKSLSELSCLLLLNKEAKSSSSA